jgi:hypothetical protein
VVIARSVDAPKKNMVINFPVDKINKGNSPCENSPPKIIKSSLGQRVIIKNIGIEKYRTHLDVTLKIFSRLIILLPKKYSETIGWKIEEKVCLNTIIKVDMVIAILYIPTSEEEKKYPTINISIQPIKDINKPSKSNGNELEISTLFLNLAFIF